MLKVSSLNTCVLLLPIDLYEVCGESRFYKLKFGKWLSNVTPNVLPFNP